MRLALIVAALLPAAALAEGHATGDPAAGKKAFRQCVSCHVVRDESGETLAGLGAGLFIWFFSVLLQSADRGGFLVIDKFCLATLPRSASMLRTRSNWDPQGTSRAPDSAEHLVEGVPEQATILPEEPGRVFCFTEGAMRGRVHAVARVAMGSRVSISFSDAVVVPDTAPSVTPQSAFFRSAANTLHWLLSQPDFGEPL